MKRPSPLLFLLVASPFILSYPAQAWAPIAPGRPTWRGAVPYELNMSGSVDLGGFGPTEVEVRRGFEDWARVSCTSLTVSYEGATSRRPAVSDGNSTVGWIESGWRFDANAIGVTQPQFASRIGEADMSMNGVNFRWITGPGSGDDVNTYSIVLHEAGHYYGLDHSSERTAAMYFAYSGGLSTLRADDQAGICALYPGAGTDCTTTGCPSGFDCTGGMCVMRMGMSGGQCATCASGSECANGICLEYPDSNGYCGANCTTAADCASGSQCIAISGIPNQCVRVVGSSPSCSATTPGCRSDADCPSTQRCNVGSGVCEARPAGAGLGAACTGSSGCSSGICIGGQCSETCDWLNPESCPTGFYCNGQATGTCNAGLCLPGVASGGVQGDPCGDNTDCVSLFCDRGICTEPCIPGGVTPCPTGYACQNGVSPSCGSCQQASALGDVCMANDDCASGLCALQGATAFCTDYCDAASSCPSGFACVTVDATNSVCVPNRGGLGAPCTDDAACAANICQVTGSDQYCTRPCSETEACPREYACVTTADGDVCTRRQGRSASGCSVTQGAQGGRASALALLALLGCVVLRRRRSA